MYRPAPNDPRKASSPTELTGQSWSYVLRKTRREFVSDGCLDLAAALTFYAVLALFPAALALLSLLGLVGQARTSVDTVLDVLDPLVSDQTMGAVEPTLRSLATSDAAGIALAIGLGGALWSASGYVGAFGRAMNRIYEIEEGRPFWKLRPAMMLVTLVALLLSAVVLLILVLSGPVAKSIGAAIGMSDDAVLAWQLARWPILAGTVILVVAMLYYATPNVRQPRWRWVSPGAALAIVAWVVAALGFALYVANLSNYDRIYGSVGVAIVALLWLWITNLALLLGAELNAELERGRELQAGIIAEVELQLPPRDTRNIDKARRKEQEDVELGRQIRIEHADQRADAE